MSQPTPHHYRSIIIALARPLVNNRGHAAPVARRADARRAVGVMGGVVVRWYCCCGGGDDAAVAGARAVVVVVTVRVGGMMAVAAPAAVMVAVLSHGDDLLVVVVFLVGRGAAETHLDFFKFRREKKNCQVGEAPRCFVVVASYADGGEMLYEVRFAGVGI
ncbi:hypothetical protein B0T17DRAFT_601006 [Bombardia bombarda]|uniref:Uncharacterized protein n=1 Tax=Bombardia bombarda TaxID=252184 RepID=A0AA39WME7_9PEZI|nr:hypothetical protein B0T17DRAFT_601006 [Bombardia bombarda]